MNLLNFLGNIWRPVLEIVVLTIFFYSVFSLIRGTRAVQVLKGLVILLIIFFLAQRLHLDTINWLLGKFFPVAMIALIILFQPELRKVLAGLGGNPFVPSLAQNEAILEAIAESCHILSKKRIGALVAIENSIGLKNYIESGVRIDSYVTPELLMTLFYPKTPLHDGGVIIQGDHIVAAACLFPLTQQSNIEKSMGTRHRAAIGLSEETDAAVVVVSEETGKVSIALNGKLSTELDKETVLKVLKSRLMPHNSKRGWIHALRRNDDEIA
jgi:diadenylate cyclase